MNDAWNIDNIQYDKCIYDDQTLCKILSFQENHQNIAYDLKLEKEILDICKTSIRAISGVLKSKARRYLWDYVISCTPLLTYCENEFGIQYNTSLKVNWCLNHRTRFPQCHNEKCKDILLYKTRIVGVFDEYNKFCCNKFLCLNQSSWHKNHVAATLKKNYGVSVPAKSPVILQRIENTCIDRYGVNTVFKLPSVQEASHSAASMQKRLVTLSSNMIEEYGVPFYVMTDEFKQKAKITNGQSKEEVQLIQFIKSICTYEITIGSFRILESRKQLDVYIDALKLAFEFNGTYYHSIDRDPQNYYYHLNKTKECENQGIRLVHIWEDEWIYDNENCKKLITDFIYGRAMPVMPLSSDYAKVDRSKFCKLFNIPGWKLINETPPVNRLRAKASKDKYIVADCGSLVFQRSQ